MKKTYAKPEFYYEKFSLLQSIAAGCVLSFENMSSPENCYFETRLNGTGDLVKVFNNATICETSGDLAGVCYNNPADYAMIVATS